MPITPWLRGGLAALCTITLGLSPQHLIAEDGEPPVVEDGPDADAKAKPPKEQKAKARSVRGTLTGHDATTITVTLPAKGVAAAESKTFALAEGATVKLGRKKVALAELPADAAVRPKLDQADAVKEVRVVKPKAAKDQDGEEGDHTKKNKKKKKAKEAKEAGEGGMPDDLPDESDDEDDEDDDGLDEPDME